MFVDEKKIDSRFLNALLRLEDSENEFVSKKAADVHSYMENFDILQEIELAELDEFVFDFCGSDQQCQYLKPSLLIAITKKSMDDSAKKRKIDRIVIGARNCFSA